MKTHGVFVVVALFAAPMLVHASCDAVKASIDAKLKAKGLEGYTLTVVAHDEPAGDGTVVGQCEGDKQIVYKKGTAASSPAEGGTAAPPARMDKKPSATPPKSDEPQPAVPSSSGG
ncbi:MAG TPA: DUF1161 domain-containing protein [Rhodanobacter sp.]|nr:DUF1161 domain-containing protein [Rhodanobacter sp.]